MQFKAIVASLLPLLASTLVTAAFCPEAARFGSLTVTPTTLAPGDTFSVTANFTCSQQYNIVPRFVDYYLEVPSNNNGHEPPVLLARHTYTAPPAGVAPLDTFTTQLPHAFYFTDAQYAVVMNVVYPISGTDNSEVLIVGGLEAPVTLTGI